MTMTSGHKNQQIFFGETGITPYFFPALINMSIFGHFSQFRAKG